ncbi:MAG: hypothetical protein WDZ41_00735 [Candidatus Babeliales bacterium]
MKNKIITFIILISIFNQTLSMELCNSILDKNNNINNEKIRIFSGKKYQNIRINFDNYEVKTLSEMLDSQSPNSYFLATTSYFQYESDKDNFIHQGQLASLSTADWIKIRQGNWVYVNFYERGGYGEKLGALILGTTDRNKVKKFTIQNKSNRITPGEKFLQKTHQMVIPNKNDYSSIELSSSNDDEKDKTTESESSTDLDIGSSEEDNKIDSITKKSDSEYSLNTSDMSSTESESFSSSVLSETEEEKKEYLTANNKKNELNDSEGEEEALLNHVNHPNEKSSIENISKTQSNKSFSIKNFYKISVGIGLTGLAIYAGWFGWKYFTQR